MKKRVYGSIARKTVFMGISMTLMGSMLAACSSGSDTSAEKRVLRIGFTYSNADNEQYLRQQYTDSFELLHPELEIEVVGAINYDDMRYQDYTQEGYQQNQPDPYEKLKEMLNGSNPVDVVVLDGGTSYLKRLVQDNMLKQLDPVIQENEFDIEDYVPSVIEGIKDAGDGSIYALTPTFNSSALYYNKKMFADAGIEVPTDNMTWDDVITLAKRIAKGNGQERTFGLQMSRWGGDAFNDMQQYYLPALQLKMFDDNAEKMTVEGPGWEKVFTTMASLYKDKIVPSQQDIYPENGGGVVNGKAVFNPFQGDLFLSNRVAMTLAGYDYVMELSRAKDQSAKNPQITAVDWGVVTMPQHAENPGIGSAITLTAPMAINAKAANPEDAWTFIEFNNSKEWAKLKSRSTYELIARKSMLKPREGQDYNIESFYTLKPVPPSTLDMDKLNREKPGIWEVQSFGQQAMMDVVQGKKTAADALKEWQTKGDATLKKLKENPTGGVTGDVYAQ
ncbi:multiple sugar transport system substrate-binding protein [Paenibacillus phyllosphaerae]|uniref:Multiple sugar transport system substrate-binding protein n=1 Tax=Paenibacillus phyllosphaerae TaxID=274593 RepID=A0A7W5FLK4_9BACL|nr:extracellular solute-binding protein [Paenibacillus phyllosphaerae]MBB3109092.1 multiple sugar transport system substrate-binding protein [Paenibacillus phyllosphaerae]